MSTDFTQSGIANPAVYYTSVGFQVNKHSLYFPRIACQRVMLFLQQSNGHHWCKLDIILTINEIKTSPEIFNSMRCFIRKFSRR